MEWLERMRAAIQYIEEHIEDPFAAEAIARVAYASPFHFQRLFHMLTNVTLAEYVRRRKLTLAAQELAGSSASVLAIALKYGYETPESFSKAFRRLHGIPPSAARKPGAVLKAYPQLSFQVSLKGEQDMDYRLVERTGFSVVGKVCRVSTRDGAQLERIPAFWRECEQDGSCAWLCSQGKTELLGIGLNMDHANEQYDYMIAVEGDKADGRGDLLVQEIPAATWAVFTAVGPVPAAIQGVWQRIYQEWFPATGYEHAGTAELEVYPLGNIGAADYRCEVWIPIRKKA